MEILGRINRTLESSLDDELQMLRTLGGVTGSNEDLQILEKKSLIPDGASSTDLQFQGNNSQVVNSGGPRRNSFMFTKVKYPSDDGSSNDLLELKHSSGAPSVHLSSTPVNFGANFTYSSQQLTDNTPQDVTDTVNLCMSVTSNLDTQIVNMKRKLESGEDSEEFTLDEISDMETTSTIDLLLATEEDDWHLNQYLNEFSWDSHADSESQLLDSSDTTFCDDGVFPGTCIGLTDYEVISNVLNELPTIPSRHAYTVSAFAA